MADLEYLESIVYDLKSDVDRHADELKGIGIIERRLRILLEDSWPEFISYDDWLKTQPKKKKRAYPHDDAAYSFYKREDQWKRNGYIETQLVNMADWLFQSTTHLR